MKFPEKFLESISTCPGFDQAGFIASHEASEQVTAIRINKQKINPNQLGFGLKERVPWNPDAYYLPQRPSFTLDPFFHAGAYYVQETSSMFLTEVMKQTCNLNNQLAVLDLCAAPGGKSTLIQSILSPHSLLVSNEVIKSRVGVLAENLSKWGASNVIVSNNGSADLGKLKGFFDVIVVDAPCSGSGLFRKDEWAMEEWSTNAVEFCSQRQQKILADVLPALKQNGILIYSTCSYSAEENEVIADGLVQHHKLSPIQLSLQPQWNIVESKTSNKAIGYRFYPDKLKGEGFFIAAFRKTEEHDSVYLSDGKKFSTLSQKDLNVLQQSVEVKSDLIFYSFQNEVFAISSFGFEQLLKLQQVLYLKKAGVQVGAILRNELLPHHELALATQMSCLFPAVELDKSAALEYLRKKEISIHTPVKGWALVKYNSLAMGFIKVLPNRVNNYYPKEWRILNK